MAIKFECPQCGKTLSATDDYAGKKGKCPTCKNAVAVPLLGTLIEGGGQVGVAEPAVAAEAEAMVSFECEMCGGNVQAREGSGGNIMECPDCGSFVEVPGGYTDSFSDDIGAAGISTDLADMEAAGEAVAVAGAVAAIGKVPCPSCERKLAEGAPVCTRCGIYVKSGRPILTAWDVDRDELEDKAHGFVIVFDLHRVPFFV